MTSNKLDRRVNACRDDLADERLKGQVEAPAFVSGVPRQVTRAVVALCREPGNTAALETEVLFGERLTVFDEDGRFAWVQLERDGYVGYISAEALSDAVDKPTHRVSAVSTFLYAKPDITSPPLMQLSMNANLSVVEETERFVKLAQGGYVVARHVCELARVELDFVGIAERFIGTPYLWGGRTRSGIDCSGLVQIALEAAGVAAPRDSDMQQQQLGDDVLIPADLDGLQRGDLVFWPGHVGIMADGVLLLHANGHHMTTVVEPLRDVASRAETGRRPPTAIKRLPRPSS